MKKTLTILFAALAIAGTAQAQVAVGARLGLNMANITGYNDATVSFGGSSSSYKNKPVFGLHAGIYTEFKISDKFSFQPELIYSMKGYKDVQEVTYNGNDNYSKYNGTLSLSYIEIPMQARLNFGGVHLLGGPYIGFLAASKVKTKSEVKSGSTVVTTESESTDKEPFKGLDAGLYLGGGYQLENGLNFGLRYCLGLADIYENAATATNSVVQFTVGYSFIKGD